MIKRRAAIAVVVLALTAACTTSTRGSAHPATGQSSGAAQSSGAGQSSGSGGSTFQATVSGAVSGPLNDVTLSADSDACGPHDQYSMVLFEGQGTVNGVTYAFGVSLDSYQGPGTYQGRGPNYVAPGVYLGPAAHSRNDDYFEAGPPTHDEMTITSDNPLAGTFDIDFTAPNTGFAVAGNISGQFHCASQS